MELFECRNELNVGPLLIPKTSQFHISICWRNTCLFVVHASTVTARCSPRPRYSCVPHNPFLCCSLLVTCKDSVLAVLRELSAITRDYSCCSLHMLFTNSDATSPPRPHGAHKTVHGSAAESGTLMSLLDAFPSAQVAPAHFHRHSQITMLM